MSASLSSPLTLAAPLLKLAPAPAERPPSSQMTLEKAAFSAMPDQAAAVGPTVQDFLDISLDDSSVVPYPAGMSRDDVFAWHNSLICLAKDAAKQHKGLQPFGSTAPLTLAGLGKAVVAQSSLSSAKADQAERDANTHSTIVKSLFAASAMGFVGAIAGGMMNSFPLIVGGAVVTIFGLAGGLTAVDSPYGISDKLATHQQETKSALAAGQYFQAWNAQLGGS